MRPDQSVRPPDDFERIDFTRWRPAKQPIITSEHEAKGDMLVERDPPTKSQRELGELGTIRFAQAHVRNIINLLWERDILDAQHVHDGQTYEVWQTIFRARTGYRNNPVYAAELVTMRRSVAQDGLNVDDFCSLIRRLEHQKCRIVEAAIYTPVSPHVAWLLSRGTGGYVQAFDTLSWIMGQLREEWKRMKEAENRTCNDHRVLT